MVRKLARQLNLKKYTIAGSYRRGKWWCNDIDLLIPTTSHSEGEGIRAQIKKLGWKPTPGRISGEQLFSHQLFKLNNSGTLVLDLFLAPPGTWGNALLFTTGPKDFNDKIRSSIIKMGYSWSNPRYFTHIKTDNEISFPDERSALSFLDMKWISPSKRS